MIEHQKSVRVREHLGDIVSPLTKDVLVKVKSHCNGPVFTVREQPVVNEGSLIARILEG